MQIQSGCTNSEHFQAPAEVKTSSGILLIVSFFYWQYDAPLFLLLSVNGALQIVSADGDDDDDDDGMALLPVHYTPILLSHTNAHVHYTHANGYAHSLITIDE